jgi:hypothetical protein
MMERDQENSENSSQPTAGTLPQWGHDELPEPLPFSLKNLFRTIGPGAILLATSIGGGEWLVGPAIGVKYGAQIFWIATISIILQVIFNLEAIRYTLYTGEPIYTGIMRLKPNSKFWSIFYTILAWSQLGLPALAAACSSVVFAAFLGRLPTDTDNNSLLLITYLIMLLAVLILLFGGTIERMLEYASWMMIAYIFIFLLTVNLLFVPFSHWWQTITGFLHFGHIPANLDIALLAALASTAGSGGIGNLTITNWIRDKGFGMGGRVGAIPSAFGSTQIKLSHIGKIFTLNTENLRRWKLWWKYVQIDQIYLWGVGCFVGMFLNVNLATYIIPYGTDLSKTGAGAFQAQYLAENLWNGFWLLALLNGFWILFSTHLGNTDILIRTVTDIVWVGSAKARNWRSGNIKLIYYVLLFVFTIWGMIVVNWANAMSLFKILANLAGVILAISSIQILIINSSLLPSSLRPSIWRKIILFTCSLFYGSLSILVLFL